jgi:hypothetical protein
MGLKVTRCMSNRGTDFLEQVLFLPAGILEKRLMVRTGARARLKSIEDEDVCRRRELQPSPTPPELETLLSWSTPASISEVDCPQCTAFFFLLP